MKSDIEFEFYIKTYYIYEEVRELGIKLMNIEEEIPETSTLKDTMLQAKNKYIKYYANLKVSNKLKDIHEEPFNLYHRLLNELKAEMVFYETNLANARDFLNNEENNNIQEREKVKKDIKSKKKLLNKKYIETFKKIIAIFNEKMI